MFHLIPFIKGAGYLGIFGVVFAETGLLAGFFLPGDTLLFSAGLLAAQGYFAVAGIIAAGTLAVILGNSLGYFIGKKFGPALFNKKDSVFFKREHVERAQKFFARYGRSTIVLACYIPVVRTFLPTVAGVARMPYRSFLTFSILGGALWCSTVALAGYFLGSRIPNVDRYILPVVLLVLILSFVPVIMEVVRSRRHSTK